MVRNEIKNKYIIKRIILKSNVKQELFKIFGGKNGLNYYFPKILPLISPNDNKILGAYRELKGITILE